MRNSVDWRGILQLCVFVAIIVVAMFLLALLRPAHGAVIDPHLTSPAYITVVAEKGDTAYSIAKLFTKREESPMPLAADFVSFNNLRYNKKGNPVIHARHFYAFPTKMSRDRIRETVRTLNTAAENAKRWRNVNVHHVLLHGGKDWRLVASPEARAFAPQEETKKEHGPWYPDSYAIFVLVSIAAAIFVLVIANEEYCEYVAKLDAAHATHATEEKPSTEYKDPQDPYEDPDAPTGLTLGEKFVNIFRAYKMEDVAKALEHDVIPVAALKMEVKYVKLRNIPESVRKHPEWREQTLHNLITHQEMALRDIGKNITQETPVS